MYNLFVCLSIRVCLYMLASSIYTIVLTDYIVDTTEERLLFFDVQKERTRLLNVCIHHSGVKKTTKLSVIFSYVLQMNKNNNIRIKKILLRILFRKKTRLVRRFGNNFVMININKIIV